MRAARNDHHAIVGKLVDARADVNTKNSLGCAFPARPVRRRSVGGGRLRLRRPAGTQRCTGRRTTAAPNPPWRCSSAAPTRPSRTTAGNAAPPASTPDGPRTESARIGAGKRLANGHKITESSPRTTRRWRRCGRRSPPSSWPAPRRAAHWRSSACTDRGLRRTPTDPRQGLRVALRTIRCRCRTAAGRAGTYHIAVHSEGGRAACRAHNHVARDALRVWLCAHSAVSRA